MEIKYFSLETNNTNKFTKIVQLIFGIVCVITAIAWVVFIFKLSLSSGSNWLTVIFLSGFGAYMIWAGLGKATRFIETGPQTIIFKKNPFLPMVEITPSVLSRIDIFPLSIVFVNKTNKKNVLRFGITYVDEIEKIKDEVKNFASLNNVPIEIKKEEL